MNVTIIARLLGNPRLIVPAGVALAAIFWLLDAVVDALFFDEEKRGLVENLIDPEPMDLWMRLVVVAFMIGFAFYARYLLRRQVEVADELARQRNLLEARVAAATHDLRERNAVLESEIETRCKIEIELEKLAVTDPLTQLYNRRRLVDEIGKEISREQRYRGGLGLILCDIDHFKQINDRHGHNTGDAVLRQLAEIFRQNSRSSDTIARWGGEEFAFLTPLADPQQVVAMGEKLRQAVEQFVFSDAGRVTASFGVAVLRDGDTVESLMKRADQGLYAAKDRGRNAVVLAD